MFSVNQTNQKDYDAVILRNVSTGNYAVIIPQWAGTLQKFVVETEQGAVNVIDSYPENADFENNKNSKDFKGSKLSPFVCRIENGTYHFAEQEYRLEKSMPAKHALHGLIYDKAFAVVSQAANDENATVTLSYEYKAEDKGYPFYYDCLITWTLAAENKLTVTTEIINKDQGLIPVQDGWHPYFRLNQAIDALELEFQAKEMVEFNDQLVPTGTLTEYTRFSSLEKIGDTFFDNCFTLNLDTCQPMCVLRDPENKIQVEFHPSTAYPYLQIYTPDHRESIAIENISGAPNAFNNGLGFTTLEAGQSALFSTSYKITLLKN